jgi:HEPN domain-containing protein/predicted nucleotidyltransferase
MLDQSTSSQKNRFRVWLEQGKYDLEAAKTSMDNKHYEWSCYQCIQSVEKVLKAIIVHGGFRPPKTHKIGVLLGMANDAEKSFEDVKLNFRKLESFTFISRYPFVIPGENKTPHEIVTKDDAETSYRMAQEICEKIVSYLDERPVQAGESEQLVRDYYYKAEEIDTRIDELVKILRSLEKVQTEKVMLFGSFAREKTRPKSSTMDILVVGKTDLPFIERIHYVREATKGSVPIIEPLVYTPDEFHALLVEEGEGFLESALDEAKVLWEKERS